MKKYTPEQLRFLALRTIGNFLVLSSIFGMFLTFGPAIKNEIVYRYNRLRGTQYIVATKEEFLKAPQGQPSHGFFRDILTDKPQIQILRPVDTDFGIIIPKIAANSKIVPNVDPGNYGSYTDALKIGVAHAQGTLFPGQGGNIYLFAHSTDNFWNVGRYNAIFYLLKELERGDEIDIFYNNIRYIYIVEETKIAEPFEISYLTENSQTEQLTLQTCWPPGTTLKRLIVIAKPIINFTVDL